MPNKPGRIDDEPDNPVAEETDKPETGKPQENPQTTGSTDEQKNDHVFMRPDELNLESDKIAEPRPNDLAKLFAGAVAGVHHELAVVTKYPNWELDAQNQALWVQFWQYLLPHIPIEQLGLYITVIFIVIFEASKGLSHGPITLAEEKSVNSSI